MKILALLDGYRKGDGRTRIDFLKKLNHHCEFNSYGPKENGVDPELAPIPFDKSLTYDDLCGIFNPDILFFIYYKTGVYSWELSGLDKLGIPVVILEEDHYTNDNDKEKRVLDWYKQAGFSLLIRRHCYKEEAPISSVWLPFSVNEEEFFDKKEHRINLISFVGSKEGNRHYDVRKKAIEVITNKKLLCNHHKIWGKNYSKILNKFKAYLSCSGGKIHTPLAKTFEIQLSGGILLSNKIDHSNLFYDNKECYVEYKDDCSDIIDKVMFILNNDLSEMRDNAIKQVIDKHTDTKRIVELHNILLALKEGKDIPKIWGQ